MAAISIIVPIFNIAEYLETCINSIVTQTINDIEIILVDDASTDSSPEICDRFADVDKRIKVIHKPHNEGLVAARKTGLKLSTSELIGYVDGDDWIAPNMYEILYNMLTDQDADVAICSRYNEDGFYSKVVKQGIPEGVYTENSMREKLFPQMIAKDGFFEYGLSPTAWDKLYKRSVLETAQMGVDDSIMMGEDAALTFPLILETRRIVVTHRCLYHYRQTESSMVKTSADMPDGAERMRFQKLYYSVLEKLISYRDVYDFAEQWKKYVLFLMIPRADVLYKGITSLPYLYPFSEIKRGERVIVYCAGLYGRRLYRFLEKTGFCKCVALADTDAQTLRKKDLNVITPKEILGLQYDAIAVASSFENTRREIMRTLEEMLPGGRVYGIDYKTVIRRDALEALGIE